MRDRSDEMKKRLEANQVRRTEGEIREIVGHFSGLEVVGFQQVLAGRTAGEVIRPYTTRDAPPTDTIPDETSIEPFRKWVLSQCQTLGESKDIFLAIPSMCSGWIQVSLKGGLPSLVELVVADPWQAGVVIQNSETGRFIYFSRAGEYETKCFAGQLAR